MNISNKQYSLQSSNNFPTEKVPFKLQVIIMRYKKLIDPRNARAFNSLSHYVNISLTHSFPTIH